MSNVVNYKQLIKKKTEELQQNLDDGSYVPDKLFDETAKLTEWLGHEIRTKNEIGDAEHDKGKK